MPGGDVSKATTPCMQSHKREHPREPNPQQEPADGQLRAEETRAITKLCTNWCTKATDHAGTAIKSEMAFDRGRSALLASESNGQTVQTRGGNCHPWQA